MEASSHNSFVHPLKFALWTGIGSIIMMFIALTSAYIVRQAAGNWLEFKLPSIFMLSTFTILLSSVTLQMAYSAFRKGQESSYKLLLLSTLALGMIFILFQYQGWLQMRATGIELSGNPSGSFVYILSGLHVAHVIGGLGVLSLACYHAFTLPYKVTKRRLLRLQLTSQYWHFVDILWIYLFIFFMIQH
ncbi:MAG TPA: cytochrome c oxidase subunit 3 [Saprospiraceae bacterium]|nr:cytochrome c oxidase subunit 3 [Saprospiraceae bacterium]